MLKKDYKACVAANQLDPNTSEHTEVADANATVGPLWGRLTRPLKRTTIVMCIPL